MNKSHDLIVCYPCFAVYLAAFNGTNWLSEQLDSILAQSGVAVTVFISVDVSTDGTEGWVSNFAKTDSRIVILPHGEKFGGAARNFFRILRDVDLSKFDYVSFSDQDDIWLPNKLLHAHEEISRTKVDAYSSNVTAFWPDGCEVLIKKSQSQVRWDFLFEAAGAGCTYVLTKKLAFDIQKNVKNNWLEIQNVALHDWFIYAFARANGYSWLIDSTSHMYYRQHDKNQVGVNRGFLAAKYRFKQLMQSWLFDQSLLISRLVGISNHPFVKNWPNESRMSCLRLILHAYQCRRRLRDKLLFAVSCVMFCFLGRR